MKRRELVCGLILLVFSAIGLNSVMAGDKKMTEEEMMAVYAKYTNPGPQHKLLEPMVGSWDCASRMWMNPDSLPIESKAVSEKQWILGGRFVQESVSGEMMGTTFHGLGITGYDLINQEYTHVYLDEMSTSMMISKGQVDSTGKEFTFYSQYKDPLNGMKEKSVRSEVTVVDNDKHIFVMYEKESNGEYRKAFDITYTRKK